jgi:hypothetical protein
MDEANVHQTVPRGLVALCLACATAIPLGAMTTPTAATPVTGCSSAPPVR